MIVAASNWARVLRLRACWPRGWRVVRNGNREEIAGGQDFFFRQVHHGGALGVTSHAEEFKFPSAVVKGEFIGIGQNGVGAVHLERLGHIFLIALTKRLVLGTSF